MAARARTPTRAERERRRVAARRRTRRPGYERIHPAVDAARRAARREGATAALHQHRGGAACAMPRSAPSPGADYSARRRGDTRRGGESGCRRLRSTLGIDAERNLQPKDARVCQTGRPALAWTRERFRESRVESGVSKLARGRRYPTTRGRDARVTFAGIMADTPYVSEFRRRTHRLPRARVLDARRRWRNRESSTAPAPGPWLTHNSNGRRSRRHPPPR